MSEEVINFLEGSRRLYRARAEKINRAFLRGDEDGGYELFKQSHPEVVEYLSSETVHKIGEREGIDSDKVTSNILKRLRKEGLLNSNGGSE